MTSCAVRANLEQMQNINLSDSLPARPDLTQILTRGVVRLFLDLGLSPITEFKLANGRRADVAAIDRGGRVTIAEVKSCRADFDVDNKWPEYRDYCDRFFFAVSPDFPREVLPGDAGLILADAYGAIINAPAPEHTLAAARRKAVLIRFARQAVWRISEF